MITTGVLLSGGLDSSILAAHLLGQGRQVQPLYVRSGLAWERQELRCLRRFLRAADSPGLEPLVVLDMPVGDLYGDHWSVTGRDVPDAGTADDAVYLPGRNALLLLKAGLWCHLHRIEELALGVLGSNPFPDATEAFFERFGAALNEAVAGRVCILRPFARLDKRQVMELGRGLPLEWTFSCIGPRGGRHCGVCNKCAERQAAFRLIAAPDPTRYAVPPHPESLTPSP